MVRRGRRQRRKAGVTATADADRPTSAAGTAPQRRCIVTGEIHDRGVLLRFVVDPDGAIVPDVAGRLPGRGLWLTPRRDIVEQAVARRVFARVARRPVLAPPGLADRIESLLARRCCDGLGLARRAGLAVAGFERVSEAAHRGRIGLLLFALDGAEGGRRKLGALGRDLPWACVLTAAELGGAFGRERMVHAAVADGPLCRRLLNDLQRLAGLRAAAAVGQGLDFAPAGPARQNGGTEAHD